MVDDWFRWAAERSPAPTGVVSGPEHRFAYANPACEAMAGGRGPILGRPFVEVWPEAAHRIVRVLDHARATGEAQQAPELTLTLPGRDGPETRWFTYSFVPVGHGDAIVVTAQDVTETVRRAVSARAEAGWLVLSNELTAALSGAQTRADVARVVFERGLSVFGADAGALGLWRDGDEKVELVDHFGYPVPLIDDWRWIPISTRSPMTDAVRTRAPVWVSSPEEARARFPEWARAVGSGPDRAWAALPLVARGRVLGGLGLGFHRPHEFPESARQIMMSVASRCGLALDRAGALDEVREAHDRLAAALEASTVELSEQDRDLRYTWALNPHHHAPELMIGRTDLDLCERRPDAERLSEIKGRVLATGVAEREEVAVQRRGSVHWYELSVSPRWRDGAICGILCAASDLTHIKESEQALALTDRRKSEFIAVLSHELRNPLAPIRNSLVLLERAPRGSEAEQRARQVLNRQTAHLVRLVDDLLDLTRIDRGKLQISPQRLDVREIARAVTDDQRDGFQHRRVALVLSVPESPVWVRADPVRLTQMIGNLLNNAIKFTPGGGQVTVTVSRTADRCEIAVRDTGRGISEADLGQIFEPFVQTAEGRRQGGLGIGLALVRELARYHGGAVHADSDGVGRGASFCVVLPIEQDGERAPALSASPPAAEHGLEILVIEDNPDGGQTLVDLLTLSGHRVAWARTGAEGIAMAAERRPELLLCDIGLPDRTGHNVIRAIRALPGPRAYAVALTGFARPSDERAALQAGFDAHLAKPPSVDDLDRLLARVSSGRERG